MNIFYLHNDQLTCAKWHNDKHCVKMILEYAQLMSTAHRFLDGEEYTALSAGNRKLKRYKLPDAREETLYKASHINHPSAIWLRKAAANYTWLHTLFLELCDEYTYRYGKTHLSDTKFRTLLKSPPNNIPKDVEFTEPTPAMPEDCVVAGDSIASYRKYYFEQKGHLDAWKKRERPSFYEEFHVH
jgi:hypothetical protein